MSKSIPLHKEHGLNPTIPTCFFCGKPKNEIALLGANYKGRAPMNMIIDTQPCEECLAGMSQGITLLGAVSTPVLNGQPVAGYDGRKPLYLSGAFVVISEDGARRMFDKTVVDGIIESRSVIMDDDLVRQLAGANTPGKTGDDGE